MIARHTIIEFFRSSDRRKSKQQPKQGSAGQKEETYTIYRVTEIRIIVDSWLKTIQNKGQWSKIFKVRKEKQQQKLINLGVYTQLKYISNNLGKYFQ